MVKVCGRCKIEKDYSMFYKNKCKKDGHQIYCKACSSKSNATSFKKHKEKRKVSQKLYVKANRSKINAYVRQWARNKYHTDETYRKKTIRSSVAYERRRLDTDVHYRMKQNVRQRMRQFLRGRCKSATTEKMLGCTWEEFREHMRNQFVEGMTFDNYGSAWHIDHIVPCAAFTAEEQRICWWYKNLQPLWAQDNQSKAAKYEEADKIELLKRYNDMYSCMDSTEP